MNALILAAGLGTRLRPVTDAWPKPAVPFLNVPIICFPIYFSSFFPVQRLVVNTHHLSEKMRGLFPKVIKTDVPVEFSDEQPAILGSGGALWKARASLDDGSDDVLVFNGDATLVDFDTAEFAKMRERHRSEQALATILVIPHPGVGTKFGGVWVDGNERVLGAGKVRPSGAVKGYHYVSVMLLSRRVFDLLPSGVSEIWDSLNPAILRGEKVLPHVIQGTWLETGNETDFLSASRYLVERLDRAASSDIALGVLRKFAPGFQNRPDKRRGSTIPNDAVLDERLAFIGNHVSLGSRFQSRDLCVLGDGVTLGDDCRLENSIVLNGATVPSGTVLKNSIFF